MLLPSTNHFPSLVDIKQQCLVLLSDNHEEHPSILAPVRTTILMLPFVAHQVDGVRRHALAEDLAPGVRRDLGELELGVVGVHAVDLLPGGGSQHLYDLHQLVHPTLPCTTNNNLFYIYDINNDDDDNDDYALQLTVS